MIIKYVNAFSTNVYNGNPAVVCIMDEFPENHIMQNIATINNVSETSFVKRVHQNIFIIRWFTPVSESPICAHATLAAAYVVYKSYSTLRKFNLFFINSNNVFIANKNYYWIDLIFPKILTRSIPYDSMFDTIFKNHNIIYIGVSKNILFVELKNNIEIKRFVPDFYFIALLPYRALLITSKDDKYDFISRYFAPSVGINEDPVCGSAHCRLIPYWSKKLNKDKMVAYQMSKRGGVIKCQNLSNRVVISGQVVEECYT